MIYAALGLRRPQSKQSIVDWDYQKTHASNHKGEGRIATMFLRVHCMPRHTSEINTLRPLKCSAFLLFSKFLVTGLCFDTVLTAIKMKGSVKKLL